MLAQNNEMHVLAEDTLIEIEEIELTQDAYDNCCKIVQLG